MRVSAFVLPAALLMLALESALPFALLAASALFHECGHLLALKIHGARPRRIDLLPMGALIVCPEGMPYKTEFTVALAGPAFSFAAAAASGAAYLLFGGVYPLYACLINALLAFFNLLPVKKLDGGKALCCLAAMRGADAESSARICDTANALSVAFCALLAAAAFVCSGFNPGAAVLMLSLAAQII